MRKPFSIRMHASFQGKHVSGAERIAESVDAPVIMQQLLARALGRTPAPDEVVVHCDALAPEAMTAISALDVYTLDCPDAPEGRRTAARVLECAGVSGYAARSAITLLAGGASSSGGVMRGAVLMDAERGTRREPDRARGVRASRFDWSADASEEITRALDAVGLTHHRTREALALASKVVHGPGIVAELCWSDDPDYTAGYVASHLTGYVRFPHVKEKGDPLGGRVIFLDAAQLDVGRCIRYLQHDPVLIGNAGRCHARMTPEEYFHVRKRTGRTE